MDRWERVLGLATAVVLTAGVAVVPIAGLSQTGQFALAAMVFAGTLWVTGSLPLPVTALLVPVVLVGLDVLRVVVGTGLLFLVVPR